MPRFPTLSLLALLTGFAGMAPAAATPLTFVWDDTFTDHNLTGSDPGGAFVAEFVVDNGGDSHLGQVFGTADLISFVAVSGGYSFTADSPAAEFELVTDEGGQVTGLAMRLDGVESPTPGGNPNWEIGGIFGGALFVNGAGSGEFGEIQEPDLSNIAFRPDSGPEPGAVPEPAGLVLAVAAVAACGRRLRP